MKFLVEDVRTITKSLEETYPKMMEENEDLQGELHMFYAVTLMKFDFAHEDLNLSCTNKLIGRCSFVYVFFSKMTTSDGETRVALKVCRDVLNETNVTDVLLEDSTLRDIDHRNVVKYYGASCKIQGKDITWIMVLEYCPGTLQRKFVGKLADSPSKHDDIYALKKCAMKTVSYFAEQICCGLEYLHSKGFVHRGLKPDNILPDEKDVVKITDVGLTKTVQDITGTMAGSPVYMASEVLLRKGQADVKVDMYNVGIILWEMWYVRDVADHMHSQHFSTFEESNTRPTS